jgi:hypothetical protein
MSQLEELVSESYDDPEGLIVIATLDDARKAITITKSDETPDDIASMANGLHQHENKLEGRSELTARLAYGLASVRAKVHAGEQYDYKVTDVLGAYNDEDMVNHALAVTGSHLDAAAFITAYEKFLALVTVMKGLTEGLEDFDGNGQIAFNEVDDKITACSLAVDRLLEGPLGMTINYLVGSIIVEAHLTVLGS